MMMMINVWRKICVFNLDLNVVSEQLVVMSVAREFQTVGHCGCCATESTIGESDAEPLHHQDGD